LRDLVFGSGYKQCYSDRSNAVKIVRLAAFDDRAKMKASNHRANEISSGVQFNNGSP